MLQFASRDQLEIRITPAVPLCCPASPQQNPPTSSKGVQTQQNSWATHYQQCRVGDKGRHFMLQRNPGLLLKVRNHTSSNEGLWLERIQVSEQKCQCSLTELLSSPTIYTSSNTQRRFRYTCANYCIV